MENKVFSTDEEIKIGSVLQCFKCHYAWVGRLARIPLQCPKCKRYSSITVLGGLNER